MAPQAVLRTSAGLADLLPPATSEVGSREGLGTVVAGAVSALLRLRFSNTELLELELWSVRLGGHCWQAVLRAGGKS